MEGTTKLLLNAVMQTAKCEEKWILIAHELPKRSLDPLEIFLQVSKHENKFTEIVQF